MHHLARPQHVIHVNMSFTSTCHSRCKTSTCHSRPYTSHVTRISLYRERGSCPKGVRSTGSQVSQACYTLWAHKHQALCITSTNLFTCLLTTNALTCAKMFDTCMCQHVTRAHFCMRRYILFMGQSRSRLSPGPFEVSV